MKTIHGLMTALAVLKPTANQLALVTAFYADAHRLHYFIETQDGQGCPYYSVANDHCGITVKLLLDTSDVLQTIPSDALMLTTDDAQKLREFIQEEIDGLDYFVSIVKALNSFPIETVTKWVTVKERCSTLHFGVDGKVLIQIELDAAKALSVPKQDKPVTWPFSTGSKKPVAYFLPSCLRLLKVPDEANA